MGRPADLPFSGASASFAIVQPGPEYRVPFSVTASASPTKLEAQTPLTLTVTVSALTRVRHPPSRIDLRKSAAFARAFYIEDLTDGKKEQVGPSTWRWVYRLKPRSAEVDEAPGVPFVFYNPDLRPVEKAFQVIYTDPIPLTVEAAEPVTRTQDLPEVLTTVSSGPGVLKQQSGWRLPGPGVLSLLLLLPPLLCLGWYRLWLRRHPDAARQARVRRSGAARRALRILEAVPVESEQARGDRVAAAVAAYLRERFDRAVAEPTPAEAMDLLLAHRCPLELAEQAAVLLRACAAVRFPPAPPGQQEGDVAALARAFILAAEDAA